jgi:hypothetical protein
LEFGVLAHTQVFEIAVVLLDGEFVARDKADQ